MCRYHVSTRDQEKKYITSSLRANSTSRMQRITQFLSLFIPFCHAFHSPGQLSSLPSASVVPAYFQRVFYRVHDFNDVFLERTVQYYEQRCVLRPDDGRWFPPCGSPATGVAPKSGDKKQPVVAVQSQRRPEMCVNIGGKSESKSGGDGRWERRRRRIWCC
jgi:hypothetical protein